MMAMKNPCGSSTGSAVGVSAGFSPLSLGTETEGSLVQPATRAALYTIKPTVGSVDMDGVWAVSNKLDVIGAMTKSVDDLANVMGIILTADARQNLPREGFSSFLTKRFDDLRIGFLSPTEWHFPPDKCRPVDSATRQMVSIAPLSFLAPWSCQLLAATLIEYTDIAEPYLRSCHRQNR